MSLPHAIHHSKHSSLECLWSRSDPGAADSAGFSPWWYLARVHVIDSQSRPCAYMKPRGFHIIFGVLGSYHVHLHSPGAPALAFGGLEGISYLTWVALSG
jgi:hypothetical protein